MFARGRWVNAWRITIRPALLLVPACCNIAGLDTPHKRFFKRLIIGASLFATCSLLTQVLLAKDVPLPFLLTGLTLVLGVTAELGPLHAKLLPASLLAAIFTLSLAGYMPVWEPLLIYALGTLWYGLFNWFGSGSGANNRYASH